MVVVEVLDEFREWYDALDEDTQYSVYVVVGLLEARGLSLGHPYSSAIRGAGIALRELRIQHQGNPIRVLYAFDPKRQAVLILGGDKTGDDRFYEWAVPRAEKLWASYITAIRKEEP